MDFKEAEDKRFSRDEVHLKHHYKMALEEFKMLKELDECDLLTPKAKAHFNALKNYLMSNLNKYLKYTWMIKY